MKPETKIKYDKAMLVFLIFGASAENAAKAMNVLSEVMPELPKNKKKELESENYLE